jgi:BMFP domain-containing protein YqiC
MSLSIRRIEFSEDFKRRLVERIREAVDRIRDADDRVDRLQAKLRRDVSDDYEKLVRQMIRDQRAMLDQIGEEFDARREEISRGARLGGSASKRAALRRRLAVRRVRGGRSRGPGSSARRCRSRRRRSRLPRTRGGRPHPS